MKYSILYNGRAIAPPDNINKIYHGATLIWERAAGVKVVIKKMFDASNLNNYRFTRTGLLIPKYVTGGDVCRVYTLTGEERQVTIPEHQQLEDGAESVFADTIMYQGGEYNPDYAITSQPFRELSIAPRITDTEEQWTEYSETDGAAIASRLADMPTTFAHFAGNGIYPMTRPLAFLQGQTEPTQLCYMTDGGLVTDAGYVVLAVLENSLLTADGITVTGGYATGRIVEREFDGTEKRVLKDEFRFCQYSANPADRIGDFGEITLIGDMLAYKTHLSAETETLILEDIQTGELYQNLFLSPVHNIVYENGVYYAVNCTRRQDVMISSDGKNWISETLQDETGAVYTGIGALVSDTDAGAVCGIDGAFYTIADSGQTDEDGDTIYSVLQIQYTVEA